MNEEELKSLPEGVLKYIKSLEQKNEYLLEKLKLALFRKYGKSSEKDDPDQMLLFEDKEDKSSEVAESDTEETITVSSHTKKKAGRKKLDESIQEKR